MAEQDRAFRVTQAAMRAMDLIFVPLMRADTVGMLPVIIDDSNSISFDPINGAGHDPRRTGGIPRGQLGARLGLAGKRRARGRVLFLG